MNSHNAAKWFQVREIGKFWFFLVYALCFGIALTLVSRFIMLLLDKYVFFWESEAFELRSFLIQLIGATAFGIYLAHSGWKPASNEGTDTLAIWTRKPQN
jgi:hypothetical protein